MKQLDFLYVPVSDLTAALAFYRDKLGLKEGWREGETTVSIELPGNEAQLMLDVDPDGRPGPVFHVDDVLAFHREHPDFTWWLEPNEIPGGHWAGFEDTSGNAIYVLDQATADADPG